MLRAGGDRNWIHAVLTKLAGAPLSPWANLAKGAIAWHTFRQPPPTFPNIHTPVARGGAPEARADTGTPACVRTKTAKCGPAARAKKKVLMWTLWQMIFLQTYLLHQVFFWQGLIYLEKWIYRLHKIASLKTWFIGFAFEYSVWFAISNKVKMTLW